MENTPDWNPEAPYGGGSSFRGRSPFARPWPEAAVGSPSAGLPQNHPKLDRGRVFILRSPTCINDYKIYKILKFNKIYGQYLHLIQVITTSSPTSPMYRRSQVDLLTVWWLWIFISSTSVFIQKHIIHHYHHSSEKESNRNPMVFPRKILIAMAMAFFWPWPLLSLGSTPSFMSMILRWQVMEIHGISWDEIRIWWDAYHVYNCVYIYIYIHSHNCILKNASFVSSLMVCWKKTKTFSDFWVKSSIFQLLFSDFPVAMAMMTPGSLENLSSTPGTPGPRWYPNNAMVCQIIRWSSSQRRKAS